MNSKIPFTKMVGTGNDFIIVSAFSSNLNGQKSSWKKLAKDVCDRRYGIGSDGLLVLEPSKSADVRMRIFNSDGSEAEMCGNGARCAAYYASRFMLKQRKAKADSMTLETKAGIIKAEIHGEKVSMQMPKPFDFRLGLSLKIDAKIIEADYINTGVPHTVIEVPDIEKIDVHNLGKQIRFHPDFGSKGTNVDFIKPTGSGEENILIRTYERGVEGETLACGTGAAAAAVLHALKRVNGGGIRRKVNIKTKSKEILSVFLTADVDKGKITFHEVVLQGLVRVICSGEFSWKDFSENVSKRKERYGVEA